VVGYDVIGVGYAATRRPDPRIGARVHAALGDARTVINVGAGTGSYEPAQTVLAVEPSSVMIEQRPPGSAPAVRAWAEALPVADGAADAAMAVLTVHHWDDLAAGLAELWRVARRRVVVLTCDDRVFRRFWLLREYVADVVPADESGALRVDRVAELLGATGVETVPVPHDCSDGFAAAFWRRPHAYLDPVVRAGISTMARLGDDALRPALDRLAADLRSGRWHERHGDLLQRAELDAGYRIIVADR